MYQVTGFYTVDRSMVFFVFSDFLVQKVSVCVMTELALDSRQSLLKLLLFKPHVLVVINSVETFSSHSSNPK